MVEELRFEHVALNVPEPARMAQWYQDHLGLKVVISLADPPFTHFLADPQGHTAIEIYNNPAAPIPDYFKQSHLAYHHAFTTLDLDATKDRLLAVGASFVEEIELPNQTRLIMLRDPWGIALQLVDRTDPWY